MPHLQTLHWLPVDATIQYKICSLCFSAINSSGPQYLADLLKIYAPSRQLRSSADSCTLCIPAVHTKSYGQRAFSHSAPTLRNDLPKAIRTKLRLCSFFQVSTKNFPVSVLQLNNSVCVVCVCVCVCVCDLCKCILAAIDELCIALRVPERRGAVQILITIIIIIITITWSTRPGPPQLL